MVALVESMKTLNIKNWILPLLLISAVYCGGDSQSQSSIWLTTSTKGLLIPDELIVDCVASHKVEISWEPITGNTADGYQIERSLDGFAFELIATIDKDESVYNDTTVSYGHSYSYRVRSVMEESDANYVSEYVVADAIVPTAGMCTGGVIVGGGVDTGEADDAAGDSPF